MTIKRCDKCGNDTDMFYHIIIRRKDGVSVNGKDSSDNDLCEKCARLLLSEAEKIDPQEAKQKMTNYGYKNGWRGIIPAKVQLCEEDHHSKNEREIFNGVTEYSCKICDYKYYIDHGD